MYDGIKIDCSVRDRRKWETSLRLIGRHVDSTGEVLPLASECQHAACTFSRTPAPLGYKYTMQGSLHRFHREGGENDDDYTLSQVRDTLETLEQKFGIQKKYSKVINFEFGVNITLPPGVEAKDFQKYLVSAYTKAFEKLNPKRPAVGYIAEFADWSVKVYDKGYQASTGAVDQIRVEIKVNRSRWLDQFGFKKGNELFLSDLLIQDNIKILGDILVQKVRSLILTPREVDFKKLSPKQRLTFTECRDARSWEEWTSKQRERKRKQLSKIFEVIGQPDPVDVLAKLVADKWNELTTEQSEPDKQPDPVTRKKDTISTVIVTGIRDIIRFIMMCRDRESRISLVHLPRGMPLPEHPPPKTLQGFNGWMDVRCRSPPAEIG